MLSRCCGRLVASSPTPVRRRRRSRRSLLAARGLVVGRALVSTRSTAARLPPRSAVPAAPRVVTRPRRRRPLRAPRRRVACAASTARRFGARRSSSCRSAARRRRAPSSTRSPSCELPRGPEERLRRAHVASPPRHPRRPSVDDWRQVGHRGGLGGVADRLRARLARSIAPGLAGERRAVVEGDRARRRQAALGRACATTSVPPGSTTCSPSSGQNVVLVAGGGSLLALAARRSARWSASSARSPGSARYVLAVGAQPSVDPRRGRRVRSASLAWLAGRLRDAWHVLLLGGDRVARLEPVHRARPGLPALVRRRRRDLRARSRGSPRGSRATRCRAVVARGVAVSTALRRRDRADPLAAVRRPAAARACRRTRSRSPRCRSCSDWRFLDRAALDAVLAGRRGASSRG